MKFINKYLIICLCLLLSKCTVYNTETFTQPLYSSPCENPTLVESMYSDNFMTLSEILKYSKTKFGNDVSIVNVHWDVFDGERKSCIFDVVRCNQ